MRKMTTRFRVMSSDEKRIAQAMKQAEKRIEEVAAEISMDFPDIMVKVSNPQNGGWVTIATEGDSCG